MTQASAERSWNVALRAQGADALELAVYDVIGKDFWTGEGVTSKDVLAGLRAAPKAKTINLRVNSIGGLVDEAKAMVNLLGERAAAGVEIVGWVDGIAASSASFLLTAAKRVVMPANTFQMIHGVRGGVRGTASDVEAGAALMRRTNDQLAEAYAAASARRGKGKTKEDFLAAFASGDTYLDADEAIEWGLADEKIEALKLAACLADLSAIVDAPEALRSANYVTLTGSVPQEPPAKEPTTHQSPIAPNPPNPEPQAPATVKESTMKSILQALKLTDDADEAAAVAAITRLQASARVGAEIEQLLGVSGQASVGAVRALKASQEENAELGNEVAKLKVVNARRDFEAARDQGLKDKKLTPAVAKLYTDRFDACLKDESTDPDARAERASGVCEDLRGFLAVAPRVVAVNLGTTQTSGSESGPMMHNGKGFEKMSGTERKDLKDENPELYAAMREDAIARRAI